MPYQREAEAVEQEFRMAGRCAKSFQRGARQLADIRLLRAKTICTKRRGRIMTLKPVNKVA